MAHKETSTPTTIGSFTRAFAEFAGRVAVMSGSPAAFALAIVAVVIWGVTGPLFHFSDTWQLVINTGTTIVTFLMVFLIQNSQNRDSAAIQVKLDEIIRSSQVSNTFIGIEHLTQRELEEFRADCEARVRRKIRSAREGA